MSRQAWTEPGNRFDRDLEREETQKKTVDVIVLPSCQSDSGYVDVPALQIVQESDADVTHD